MDPITQTASTQKTISIPKGERKFAGLKYFFVFIGLLSLLYVIAGFTPTYFAPLAAGSFKAKPVYHIHGIMYMLWIALIISQPLLIRFRLTHLHKKIGYAGLTLAVGMFVIGVVMAFTANQVALEKGAGNTALTFLIIPLTDMMLFGTFITLTMMNLKNSEVHKRLILLATLSILPAAFGRIIGIYGISIPIGYLMQESILILGITYDLYTRRKIHPVYSYGGVAVVIIHLVRFPLGETDGWLYVARLLSLVWERFIVL
jgi:hypothetical protein